MENFIKSIAKTLSSISEMSNQWQALSENDSDKVNAITAWGEIFNISVDEIPFVLSRIIDELEGK
jgi:hypothetical protein